MAFSVQRIKVDGVDLFYREAGAPNAPVILLLHGFPTSSFQYRNLITRLASKYRVLALDFPGFGFTDVAAERKYEYTFENLAKTTEAFLDALKITKFAMYIFDYGAPVGLRVALARPQAVTAIISQNGNTFEQGLGDAWAPIRAYWADPSTANRDALRGFLTYETTKMQYTGGESHPERIAPETYHIDQALLDRPGNNEIQLNLFYDYRTNVALYPTFQDYLKKFQPPLLAVWGKNDIFFIPAGAEAFKTILPKAQVSFIDGGHFVLENHLDEISEKILAFLDTIQV